MTTVEKTEYRLENLTCASCAMKFENNVKDLPAIEDAQVNFGASKLSFSGSATIEDLEAAGAFDGIKVVPLQNRKLEPKKPFFHTQGKYCHYSVARVLNRRYDAIIPLFGSASCRNRSICDFHCNRRSEHVQDGASKPRSFRI